jgi:hypothetical protein
MTMRFSFIRQIKSKECKSRWWMHINQHVTGQATVT